MAEVGSRCVVQGGGEVAARSIRRRRVSGIHPGTHARKEEE
jgi:hypothetical protein